MPEDTPHMGDSIISTSLPEDMTDTDYSPSSSSSPDISSDNELNSQKERDEAIIKHLSATSSMEKNQEELQLSTKEVDSMESVRGTLISCLIASTFIFIFFLWILVKMFGTSVYYLFLFCHSLLFSGLFIVHYIFLPSLIQKRYSLSCETDDQKHYAPAYRPSKGELLWGYLRMLCYYLTNAGIWKCVSYMDNRSDVKYNGESLRKASILSFLGMLLLFSSFYVVLFLGPLYSEVTEEFTNELTKYKDKILKIEESNLRELKEDLPKIMEVLKENDKENKTLRRENEELNSKIQCWPKECNTLEEE